MHHDHHYRTELHWSGSTAAGYEAYAREHVVAVDGVPNALEVTADPAFGGDPSVPDPEQLVVVAASSCQLLSFLAIAARARVEVTDYRDEATASMRTGDRRSMIDEIVLRPRIIVRSDASDAKLGRLVALAHDECYIANSLRTPVRVEATFERAP